MTHYRTYGISMLIGMFMFHASVSASYSFMRRIPVKTLACSVAKRSHDIPHTPPFIHQSRAITQVRVDKDSYDTYSVRVGAIKLLAPAGSIKDLAHHVSIPFIPLASYVSEHADSITQGTFYVPRGALLVTITSRTDSSRWYVWHSETGCYIVQEPAREGMILPSMTPVKVKHVTGRASKLSLHITSPYELVLHESIC